MGGRVCAYVRSCVCVCTKCIYVSAIDVIKMNHLGNKNKKVQPSSPAIISKLHREIR